VCGKKNISGCGVERGINTSLILDNPQLSKSIGSVNRIFGQVRAGNRKLKTCWFILFVNLFVNSSNPVTVFNREIASRMEFKWKMERPPTFSWTGDEPFYLRLTPIR